jgi:hypothetical protein
MENVDKEELHNLYYSTSIIRMKRLGLIFWGGGEAFNMHGEDKKMDTRFL